MLPQRPALGGSCEWPRLASVSPWSSIPPHACAPAGAARPYRERRFWPAILCPSPPNQGFRGRRGSEDHQAVAATLARWSRAAGWRGTPAATQVVLRSRGSPGCARPPSLSLPHRHGYSWFNFWRSLLTLRHQYLPLPTHPRRVRHDRRQLHWAKHRCTHLTCREVWTGRARSILKAHVNGRRAPVRVIREIDGSSRRSGPIREQINGKPYSS
jgi:hypothetical protein